MKFFEKIEKWGFQEIVIKSDKTFDNPFVEAKVLGTFTGQNERVTVDGFYNGDGEYIIRFMPSYVGKYKFEIVTNLQEESFEGEFDVLEPTGNNHGPVRVVNTYHFAYEDKTPYYSVGTTCYAWTHQEQSLQEKTMKELEKGYFNKIRFCVFPKHYEYNFRDPISFPYEGKAVDNSKITRSNFREYNSCEGNDWDFYRFNPKHFQILEKRIIDLMKLGIEADIIIMHPYDRWGFSKMSIEQDCFYIKYLVSRLAAFRNVWWSLANEYDFIKNKTLEDWQKYADVICEKDPYNHLRSIHNGSELYDFNKQWVTHCSVQRIDLYKTTELADEYRNKYKKPVVFDEVVYEGNANQGWGNISGQELVRRFWEGAVRGAYVGHGETYMHPEDILWWSHGGELHGESPQRIKFLHEILCQTPGLGLKSENISWDIVSSFPEEGSPNDYLINYFGLNRPAFREYYFGDDCERQVELIDTWNMKIEKVGTFKNYVRVDMPGREYMAVRIKKI